MQGNTEVLGEVDDINETVVYTLNLVLRRSRFLVFVFNIKALF